MHPIGWIYLIVVSLIFTGSAEAYIGPGAGLSAIGTVAALGLGIILALVGFVWYPLKRLVRRLRREWAMSDHKAGPA
jgi:hypothetical protein